MAEIGPIAGRLAGAALLLAAVLACGGTPADAAGPRGRGEALREISGEIVRLETVRGEGGLDARVAWVRLADGREVSLLVAPPAVLERLGMVFAPGDRIRARVFVERDPPWPVHKIRNVSRGQMARLRTLTHIPLWDGSGHWVGWGGPHGGGHHGGQREGGMRHRR